MLEAGRHGAVNWVDLSTPDLEEAATFYHHLFGWAIQRSTSVMGEYLIASVGDRQVAGMMGQGQGLEGQPPVWTVFVSVDDIDATMTTTREAGGEVLTAPFSIPGNTRVAVVADPGGAMLGVISGPRPDGAFFCHDPGGVSWVELLTHDPFAAEGFYTAVFGWKAVTQQAGATLYTIFKLEDEDVSGMMMMPDDIPAGVPAHWAVYFAVADSTAAEKRALELGGNVLRPTTEIDIGRFAVLADPQGATFHLMEFAEYR